MVLKKKKNSHPEAFLIITTTQIIDLGIRFLVLEVTRNFTNRRNATSDKNKHQSLSKAPFSLDLNIVLVMAMLSILTGG